MSRYHIALTTAAAAAAVALSACSATEAKPWPTAVVTGGAVAAPTSATVAPIWVTAPWTGKVNANNNPKGIQFGGTPVPGIVVAQQVAEARKSCTIGVAVQAAEVGNAFVTAGHCDRAPGGALFLYPEADSTDADAKQLPTTFVKTDTHAVPDVGTGLVSDSTLLPVSTVDRAATKIAGRYPIAGVLTTAVVKQLPTDTPVCLDGAVSGLVCGQLVDADDGGLVRFDVGSRDGDSGGPVFLLDQQHRAVLIGIHKRGDGTTAAATYLEPALTRLGAGVMLDPSVQPMDGPDFSPRVTSS
ncbi:hypothetical protein [Mycobacteroides chelonae]|uniref:hypothetical protein n=1 Tax=Mycobacteroides chelonae TaxID=1774 RepID=UPI0012FF7C98|nr:hypothetical protein [Mycobacteroides chelonae]